MKWRRQLAVLLDMDNTRLHNGRLQDGIGDRLEHEFGHATRMPE